MVQHAKALGVIVNNSTLEIHVKGFMVINISVNTPEVLIALESIHTSRVLIHWSPIR